LKVTKANPKKLASKVTWTSKRKKIATVSDTGVVTALKPGTTVITAVSEKDASVKASVKVRVSKKISATKNNLNRKKKVLYVGESMNLKIDKTKQANADLPETSWKSKKKKVASVSDEGVVTALKPGTTTITVTSKEDPSVKASVRVQVKAAPTKEEKTCTATAEFSNGSEIWSLMGAYGIAYDCHPDKLVIRSKEEFQELEKLYKNSGDGNLKDTWLAAYKNMDFSKESLVLLTFTLPLNCGNTRLLSCVTRLDADGKLYGVLNIEIDSHEMEEGVSYPAVLKNYSVALRIPRKEEAMIDAFEMKFQ
jgi:hypothetical protein